MSAGKKNYFEALIDLLLFYRRYSLPSAHYKTVYSYMHGFIVAETFNSIVLCIISLQCTPSIPPNVPMWSGNELATSLQQNFNQSLCHLHLKVFPFSEVKFY